MKTRVENIRDLASRETQERYIVNGTASEYLLAEEMLESAFEFIRLVEHGRIGSSLTAFQRDRLAELKVAMEAADTDLPNEELVYRNQAWDEVRRAAQNFLDAYDVEANRPAG